MSTNMLADFTVQLLPELQSTSFSLLVNEYVKDERNKVKGTWWQPVLLCGQTVLQEHDGKIDS